ncbi:MAG: hypothetical protein GY823_00580, partial [Flavobacteriaceae bacterium]|nr:hypothetical protein [Flavobacteriaceae bacterium]
MTHFRDKIAGGLVPHDYALSMAKRGRALLADVEENHWGKYTSDQQTKVDAIHILMMEMQQYDTRALNVGSKKIPKWQGDHSDLKRYLAQLDILMRGIPDDAMRRAYLESSVREEDAIQFKHCTTYTAARAFLEDLAQNSEAITAHLEQQLLTIPTAQTEEEEEENLTDAMVKLGGAMQASAQYKLIHYKAQRVFRCTLLRKRDNYMRDVEGVYAEECRKQGKDDPNMAQGIYDLLKRHRKLLQNLIQI